MLPFGRLRDMVNEANRRDSSLTENIAVGNQDFTEAVKETLGMRERQR